jgi:peroxiredoxin/mono/diheme cytochrome c family protein
MHGLFAETVLHADLMRKRMQRKLLAILGLVVLLATQYARGEDGPWRARLGQKVEDLSFRDAAGKTYRLYELKDQKAIVLIFLSFECPVSNSYAEPLTDMVKEYGKHDVTFWGLIANEDESREQVAKSAREFNLNFPVFKDEKLRAANALQAGFSPEVFVLDSNYVVRYRGRIDDSWAGRLKKHTQVTRHDLRQALGELLSGRPVATPATQPIGCPIVRQERAIARGGKVTYHRDIAPILQQHCQSCHRPGEVGPFSLLTYKQAINWADDIKEYTQKRIMPPWKPIAGPAFHNDRRLSDDDIATLAAWVDGGLAEGDPKNSPPARTFPQGWQLGTPDLVLTASDEFLLGPTGNDVFRCFVLPTNLKEDVYVVGVEVRPSNPRVVHHVLNFIDTKGKGRELEKLEQERLTKAPTTEDRSPHAVSVRNGDRGPGYTVSMGAGFQPQGGLTGWAPGNLPRYLPEGVGFPLPKGSDIVMQVHFHRNGRAERDRTQLGLYFAKKKIDRPHQGAILFGTSSSLIPSVKFTIPAGKDHFVLKGDTWASGDFTLFSVMPHMHMLGKEIQVTMTPPDGPTQPLVAIKDWDYNWQETYLLKQPIHIKAGTRFHVEAVYDNSEKNPRNPSNPPRDVTYGEQTTNEMCFIFLGGYSDQPGGRASPGRGLPMSYFGPQRKAGDK